MFTTVLRENIQSFFVKGQMVTLLKVTCTGRESEWIF